ncbi:hypothetical protein ACFQY0_06885 [Haloferula chungangensis]|uniref:Outer membrane protein beta-barrel domain-containing protein n=1 Tax=Haloferula chungangensis TaxID=1048331 RepID=A0ABW2L5R0_9BACT
MRPDISGLTSSTTNWAYQDASQYDPSNGGTLAFTSTAAGGALPSLSYGEDDPDGELAFEIFAEIELGRIGGSSSAMTWGMHVGFHYADLDSSEAGVARGTATQIVDRFPLGGVIPPLAPYSGSFTGPGPLLDTRATRSSASIPGGSLVSRSNDLHTNLFTLNLGPWISYHPSERFQLRAELGLSLALADSTYKYASTTSLASGSSASTSGRVNDHSVLPGFYIGAMTSYALSEQTGLYLSARYQYLDSVTINTSSASADLSFDEAFIISAGLIFNF